MKSSSFQKKNFFLELENFPFFHFKHCWTAQEFFQMKKRILRLKSELKTTEKISENSKKKTWKIQVFEKKFFFCKSSVFSIRFITLSPWSLFFQIPKMSQLLWGTQKLDGAVSTFPVVRVGNVVALPGVPKFCERAFDELQVQLYGLFIHFFFKTKQKIFNFQKIKKKIFFWIFEFFFQLSENFLSSNQSFLSFKKIKISSKIIFLGPTLPPLRTPVNAPWNNFHGSGRIWIFQKIDGIGSEIRKR